MTPPADEQMYKPLRGLTVLDLSIMMAGPYCARMLCDLGARVIKVEAPGGEQMRGGLPLRDGSSAYFAHLNAGKESIVLDLKQPRSIEALLQMVDHADVVVENFRPGVTERLGLGYPALAARNPRLVYCSISGYGQSGRSAKLPAFAPIVHAACGLDLAIMTHQERDTPPATGIFTADVLSAMFGVIAIQAALRARETNGLGQHIDLTLFEGMFNLMPFEVQEAQFPLAEPRPVYKPIRALDGLLMLMVVTQANFESLCDAIERPELKADPRFSQALARSTNRMALMTEVEVWTRTRSVEACENAMADRGVPCTRYRSVRENLVHHVVAERESFAKVHDAAGALLVPSLPFLMNGRRPFVEPKVAGVGEHTDAVLREFTTLSTVRNEHAAG